MTKQKKIILDIIQNSMSHLTAEEIFSLAKNEVPSISLGTVYRNLGVLADEKLIRKLTTPFGKDAYDKSIIPHGHIICPVCGKIDDYNSDDVDHIIKRDFEEFVSYELNITRVCNYCSNKK